MNKNKNDNNAFEEKDKRIRKQVAHWFSRYDFRDKAWVTFICRRIIFFTMLLVMGIISLKHIERFTLRGGWQTMSALIAASVVMVGGEAIKLFANPNRSVRLVLYVLQAISASAVSLLISGASALLVYMLVLTELYIALEGKYSSFLVFAAGVFVYVAACLFQNYFFFEPIQTLSLLTQLFTAVFVFAVHFLVMQFALAFYRQFIRLNRTMKDLDESKRELEEAYKVVFKVATLEERQRIAKEIHDTAGHAITTVIAQTEAAKLLVADNPDAAKQKIIAANLQAKHALEELRDSVHVLSGRKENQALKEALEDIINQSTDATDIIIRSEIDEIEVSAAKFRLLCNSLKEGISNGIRHGGATAFWFECKRKDDTIVFLLSDNGTGTAVDETSYGFGLSSMQDGAKSLGGALTVLDMGEEGFEIQLTLPIDVKKEEESYGG